MNRRMMMLGGSAAAATAAAGCAAPAARRGTGPILTGAAPPPPAGWSEERGLGAAPTEAEARRLYAAAPEETFPLPAVDPAQIPPAFWRRRVAYDGPYAPGTLHVDTAAFHLFLVEPRGTAMRYGVSLGRAGFAWAGMGEIWMKRAWPKWTPPDSMIAREPHLEQWSVRNGGMPPGLDNPLGARALYIFENGVDTLYRVHGTPFPDTIGTAASSGCVRMINQDVIDLYERVRPGARIIVV